MPAPVPEVEDPAAGAAAVAATRQYLDAYVAGRAEEFCALETPEFAQEQIDNAVTFDIVKKGVTCVEFVKAMRTTSGYAPTAGPAPTYEVMALEAAAEKATVRVDYPSTPGTNPDRFLLVKRDDRWLIAEDMGAAGS